MGDPTGEQVQLSITAVIRELRRSLAELEAAEDAARQQRQRMMQELDQLVERVQHAEQELKIAQAEAEVTAAEEAESPGQPSGEVPRILIADDSSTSARLAGRLVERMGYAVDLVRDGVEALEKLEEQPYAAVLMDCKMPRMDGYQATRAIRQLPGEVAETPVIALTSNTMEGDDLRCFVAGMDDYLAKPVHAGQLEERLQHWVLKQAKRRA